MNVSPIIFSGPMVCALLESRKTMTRRILKPQPVPFMVDERPCDVGVLHVEGDPRPRVTLGRVITKQAIRYAVGDRLWVRETFATDGPVVRYAATDDIHELRKKRPSIHMPRWASRLTLVVTGLKVERVQDIPLLDVWAEGCEVRQFWLFGADGPQRQKIGAAVFGNLWEEIHGREGWHANPFVVAISFSVIKANIDAPEARRAA